MADVPYDYTADMPEPSDDVLGRITRLVNNSKQVELEIAKMEASIKVKQEKLRKLKEQDIPALMDEVQLKELKTKDGIPLEIVEVIRTSIPKARKDEAHDWMEDHDHGALVKRTVTIQFGRDDEKWADKFERDCARRKKPLNLARARKVESATLKKFVKDQLDAGVDIPLELFGVFRQKVAKIG